MNIVYADSTGSKEMWEIVLDEALLKGRLVPLPHLSAIQSEPFDTPEAEY